MQFDRSADGTLTPLPKPRVDTGAGLERIAAVMQGKDDNFHTDLFQPLIDGVAELVGRPYPGGPEGEGLSFRVLADHARAVTFLILDGVYPGQRWPRLRACGGSSGARCVTPGCWAAADRRSRTWSRSWLRVMGDAYPALAAKQGAITNLIRSEEREFFETIEAGLERLEQIRASGTTTIPGEDAFKLFDTFGFPIDLTQMIAGEWGIAVDATASNRR